VTQYESLALSLLATIADGIMLQLTQPPLTDEARRRRHDELVRSFRKGTEELVDVVTGAIAASSQPPADTGPTAGQS
jgi:hypothetical protein